MPIGNPFFCIEHDTNPDKPKYRPPFLDHFDRKKTEAVNNMINMDAETNSNAIKPLNGTPSPSAPPEQPVQSIEERQRYQSHLQLQLNQISAANQMGVQHLMHHGAGENVILQRQQDPVNKYQRNFVDGDFEFVSPVFKSMISGNCKLISHFNISQLKFLSFDDLQQRLSSIDVEMEREIDELNRKYTAKRQPILDAMDAKRKRQQNLNNNLIKI